MESVLWWRREGEVGSGGEGEGVRGDWVDLGGGVFASSFFFLSCLCPSFSVKINS